MAINTQAGTATHLGATVTHDRTHKMHYQQPLDKQKIEYDRSSVALENHFLLSIQVRNLNRLNYESHHGNLNKNVAWHDTKIRSYFWP